MQKYKKVKSIGKGSFGYAVLVRNVEEGDTLMVMKIIDIEKMNTKQKEESLNEIRCLKALDNPFIIKYKESFIEKKALCIVMDFADGGDLYAMINDYKARKAFIPEPMVIEIFSEICLAMEHVHSKKILHRDLKTQNIFLTKTKQVKLGDFGISRILQHTYDLAKTAIGTPYYLSPEICQETPYNHKSDIWSLGCILYEMLSLNHAFDAVSMKGLVLKILQGNFPPPPEHYSRDLKDLLAWLLKTNPDQRPGIEDVLEHPAIAVKVRSLKRIYYPSTVSAMNERYKNLVYGSSKEMASRPDKSKERSFLQDTGTNKKETTGTRNNISGFYEKGVNDFDELAKKEPRPNRNPGEYTSNTNLGKSVDRTPSKGNMSLFSNQKDGQAIENNSKSPVPEKKIDRNEIFKNLDVNPKKDMKKDLKNSEVLESQSLIYNKNPDHFEQKDNKANGSFLKPKSNLVNKSAIEMGSFTNMKGPQGLVSSGILKPKRGESITNMEDPKELGVTPEKRADYIPYDKKPENNFLTSKNPETKTVDIYSSNAERFQNFSGVRSSNNSKLQAMPAPGSNPSTKPSSKKTINDNSLYLGKEIDLIGKCSPKRTSNSKSNLDLQDKAKNTRVNRVSSKGDFNQGLMCKSFDIAPKSKSPTIINTENLKHSNLKPKTPDLLKNLNDEKKGEGSSKEHRSFLRTPSKADIKPRTNSIFENASKKTLAKDEPLQNRSFVSENKKIFPYQSEAKISRTNILPHSSTIQDEPNPSTLNYKSLQIDSHESYLLDKPEQQKSNEDLMAIKSPKNETNQNDKMVIQLGTNKTAGLNADTMTQGLCDPPLRSDFLFKNLPISIDPTDTLSYKIEALRIYLENTLGLNEFIKMYNGIKDDLLADGYSEAEKYLPLVHQLIFLEDKVYSQPLC